MPAVPAAALSASVAAVVPSRGDRMTGAEFVAVLASPAPPRVFPVDPVHTERVARTIAGDLSWLAELLDGLDDLDAEDAAADPRCGCGCGR